MNDFLRLSDFVNTRRPDYHVNAEIASSPENNRILRCKLWLPQKTEEEPIFKFYSENMSLSEYSEYQRFSLRAETFRDFQKTQKNIILADEVYAFKSIQSGFGLDGKPTIIFFGKPMELTVIFHFSKVEPKPSQSSNIIFSINRNRLLEPDEQPRLDDHESGNVTTKRDGNLISINDFFDNNKLLFKNIYNLHTLDEGGFQVSLRLVAETTTSINASDYKTINQEIVPKIDDALLLASFAERERCVCTEWTASNTKVMVSHYRVNKNQKVSKIKSRQFDTVMKNSDFNEFINHSFSKLKTIKEKNLLIIVFYTLNPFSKSTIEARYRNLFSALEHLIMVYRKNNKKEYLFEKNIRKKIRGEVKNVLLTIPELASHNEKVDDILDNLNDLTRIKLADAFLSFCNHYGVLVDDLWPVFDNRKGVSLYKLRNNLTHGGKTLTHEQIGALMDASWHLERVIERCILGLLEWPIAKSNLTKEFLSEHFAPVFNRVSENQKLFKNA